MTLRRLLAQVVFISMLVGLFEPYYWKMFTVDRPRLSAWLTELSYSRMPGYRSFLEEVRARTDEGETIAIWVPMRQWFGGYGYAFCRAQYLLAGRKPIPLLGRDDRPLVESLRQAEWVAAWHGAPAIEGFTVVWRDANGTLLRRSR